MKTTRLLAASACLLLTVSLSACSKETEKPRATATPSAAPATSKPPQPRDAESTIRAWMAAMLEMQNTGDPNQFLGLSTEDCKYCNDFSARVRKVYEAGGSAKIQPIEIKNISPLRGNSKTRFIVQFVSGSGVVHPTPEAKPEKFPGGPQTFLVEVQKEEERWRIQACVDAS